MMKYPESSNDPRAKFPGLEWKYTRDQVAQMVSFEANKAGVLASENMAKMGITWVSFEGKRFEYKPAVPGAHYKLIVEVTWEKVKQNQEESNVKAQFRTLTASYSQRRGPQLVSNNSWLLGPSRQEPNRSV